MLLKNIDMLNQKSDHFQNNLGTQFQPVKVTDFYTIYYYNNVIIF